jgi:hypothetical protein
MSPTPTHWTYDEIESKEVDLFQGDILVLTDDLRSLLNSVHNHFTDSKYLGFIITTQSCDLVLRKNKCKAAHINLSVIKSLENTLKDLLDQYCQKICMGVYTKESKQEAKMLIERILNQNEEKLGLFYLHPDTSVEIGEPAIAVLRVSIALRNEHYSILRSARRGRLKSEFRNKLGWLVGNLYSRAATTDWHENNQQKQMESHIETLLKNAVNYWPPQSVINDIKSKMGTEWDRQLDSEKIELLKKHTPPPFKDEIAKKSSEILQEIVPDIAPDIAKKFETRLKNDPAIAQTIKYYQKIMSTSPDEFEDIL